MPGFKRIVWIAAGVALLAALGWSFRPRAVPVEVAEVVKGPFAQTVEEDGATRVRERYAVSAPLAGRLLRVSVEAGDPVQKGGALAVIVPSAPAMLDPRTRAELSERVGAAEARVERARAAAERAGAALDQSRADLARTEKLERGGFVSPSAREQAQLAVRVSEKELEAARFERHAAEHDLSQARAALARARSFGGNGYERGAEWEIRSPVAGRVLKVLKESEDVVDAGAPILEIGDPRDLEVVLDVLSTEAVRVKPGADVELDAGGGLRLSGRVRLVEPSAFTKVSALGVEEQRVNVIADLTSPPEAWQALGDAYRVDARIVVHRETDAVKVPVAALFRDDAEWAVFVVSEGRAERRRVRIARRGALEAVVEQGLSPGERVIAYPGDAVRDGARVQAISGREM